MPKMKTHKGIAKRMKKTKKGKLKRKKGFHAHILTKKSSSRKRSLKRSVLVNDSHKNKYKNLISK